MVPESPFDSHPVEISSAGVALHGDIVVPPDAHGLVLFAHGSGSDRHSPRNRFVAHALQQQGLATLLMDLLTREEERHDEHTGHLRFDIGLLADRLSSATAWAREQEAIADLRVGYFGASTGAAAALVAAAANPDRVRAVVSRGGRPDLADQALRHVHAPTLLVVGGRDEVVIGLNERAMTMMHAPVDLVVVPGATHLFEEPGALEQVARLASDWFCRHLTFARAA